MVYSTCRVDLSRYSGSGRYSGIRVDFRDFTGRCGSQAQHIHGRTHRRVHVLIGYIQSWSRDEILVLCPIWVSWFDNSMGMSNPKVWIIVTERPMGQMGRAVTVATRYCSVATQYPFSPKLETEREVNQLK